MATKDYADFVRTEKPVPIQNPRVGSGTAKSIDDRTTFFSNSRDFLVSAKMLLPDKNVRPIRI
jgi:hypothetical protein